MISSNFRGNGCYEVAPTASFNIQFGRDRTQQTCSSGSQKLLAVESSKKSSHCYSQRKKRNRDSSGLHEVSGNYWIPPVVLYKGNYRGEDFGDAINAGSTRFQRGILQKGSANFFIISITGDHLEEPF
jgi:hypothetical protein